ncbi:AAA family ATPase [Desulfurobacterium sp.]
MLRLRHLSLKGFLSHKNTDLSFEDASYIIIGSNASGKTSLLRGIFFGLFGEDIVFGRRNLINLVNREKTSAEVTLSFLTGGREYTVIRKITPKGNQCVELYRDGARHAAGVKVCEEVLRNDLGLEPEIFKNTVYVPQGELVTFLEGTPKARREILNRLFGLEEIAKKYETIKAFAKQIELEFSKFEFQLHHLENLRQKLLTINHEIKELEYQISEEEKRAAGMKALLLRQQKILKSFEERKAKVEAIEKERTIYKEQLSKLFSEIEKKKYKLAAINREEKKLPELKEKVKILPALKDIEEKVTELKFLMERRRNLEEERKRFELLKREFSRKRERLEFIEKEIARISSELQQIGKRLNDKKEAFELLKIAKSKYESLNEKLSYIKKEIERKKKKLEKLPVLDLESLKNQISELEVKISQLEKNKVEIESLLKIHRERLEKFKIGKVEKCPICGSVLSSDKVKQLIAESSSFIKEHNARLEVLKKELENLKEKRKKMENDLKEAVFSLKERENLEKELLLLKKDKDDIARELYELSFSPEKFAVVEEELEKLKDRFSSFNNNLFSLKDEKDRLKREIKKLSEDLEAFDEEKNIEKMHSVEKEINRLKSAISELKKSSEITISTAKELKQAIEDAESARREIERITAYIEARPEIQREIELLSGDIEALKEKIRNCDEQLKAVDYDKSEHETIIKTVADSEEKLSQALKILNEKRGTLTEKRETLVATEKEVKELEKIKENIKVLKSTYDVIKQVESGFHPSTGFVTELRRQLLPEIANICKAIFAEFNFDFSEITIAEDLTVKFGIPGQGVVTLDQLSGGQKVAFALALRFALARKFMSKFELLILDEPTIHLDDERKRELADILLSLRGKIPQMIVVTHDPELEVAGDKIIRVERTVNGSTIKITEGE